MVTPYGNLVPLWWFIFTKEVTHPICESGWTQVALVGLPQSENEAILLHHPAELQDVRIWPNYGFSQTFYQRCQFYRIIRDTG